MPFLEMCLIGRDTREQQAVPVQALQMMPAQANKVLTVQNLVAFCVNCSYLIKEVHDVPVGGGGVVGGESKADNKNLLH